MENTYINALLTRLKKLKTYLINCHLVSIYSLQCATEFDLFLVGQVIGGSN